MQDLIKRYFWILGVIAVVLCAVFAAKATGAIIEANFLGGPSPTARLVGPSHELAADKQQFGATRRKRWFGSG